MLGDTIDSELSGNMIDICPVGALTSKPFRYSARTWELSRRKSVSPHDSTGANLIVQVKTNQVMRVVPLENEAVNECWIADRDRFSYEALNSEQRLTQPMIKQGGAVAGGRLEHRAGLRGRRPEAHQGRVRRAAPSARSARRTRTVEELHLLAKLVRGLGSENIDHRCASRRLRQPAAPPAARAGSAPASHRCRRCSACWWSARSCARTIRCSRSACARRRATARKLHSLHAVHDDWAMPLATQFTAAPSGWVAGAGRVWPRPSRRPRALPRRWRRPRATRRGDCRLAAWRRAQGRAARQRRRAASAGDAVAGAGAMDRRRKPAPRSATSARPPTASVRNWSARCRARAG